MSKNWECEEKDRFLSLEKIKKDEFTKNIIQFC